MIIRKLLEVYANAYSDKRCLETFVRMFERIRTTVFTV